MMRELSVYYCPRCGRYGYYQLVKNAVCPSCNLPMRWLDMPYQNFMRMNLETRDSLISNDILIRDSSILNRISAADRAHNKRQIIASLNTRIHELEAENIQLSDTIDWMHQTIWDLLARNKALERQLKPDAADD